MKRESVFGVVIAVALGVSTVAQGTPAQTYPQQSDRDKERVTITVIGCLVPGSQGSGAVGTSGTTAGTATTAGSTIQSTTAAAGGFMLINAKEGSTPDPASTTATTGTSGTTIAGTSGGASRTDDGKSFILIGGDQSDLQRFVNSRVEIQGSIEPAAYNSPAATTATTSTSGTSTMTGAAGQTREKKPAQRLRVTSVRQVADSCSGGQT